MIDHLHPGVRTPQQEAAAKASIMADGINHAMDVIGEKLGADLQVRMIGLTWVISAELAKITDTKIRKEARAVLDRQISVNLARILSGLGG